MFQLLAQAERFRFFEAETTVELVHDIYWFGVGIIGIVAVVVIVVAGIMYMQSFGDPEKIKKAKELIGGAIAGVVLLLFSYTILYTINPALVRLREPEMPGIRTTGAYFRLIFTRDENVTAFQPAYDNRYFEIIYNSEILTKDDLAREEPPEGYEKPYKDLNSGQKVDINAKYENLLPWQKKEFTYLDEDGNETGPKTALNNAKLNIDLKENWLAFVCIDWQAAAGINEKAVFERLKETEPGQMRATLKSSHGCLCLDKMRSIAGKNWGGLTGFCTGVDNTFDCESNGDTCDSFENFLSSHGDVPKSGGKPMIPEEPFFTETEKVKTKEGIEVDKYICYAFWGVDKVNFAKDVGENCLKKGENKPEEGGDRDLTCDIRANFYFNIEALAYDIVTSGIGATFTICNSESPNNMFCEEVEEGAAGDEGGIPVESHGDMCAGKTLYGTQFECACGPNEHCVPVGVDGAPENQGKFCCTTCADPTLLEQQARSYLTKPTCFGPVHCAFFTAKVLNKTGCPINPDTHTSAESIEGWAQGTGWEETSGKSGGYLAFVGDHTTVDHVGVMSSGNSAIHSSPIPIRRNIGPCKDMCPGGTTCVSGERCSDCAFNPGSDPPGAWCGTPHPQEYQCVWESTLSEYNVWKYYYKPPWET